MISFDPRDNWVILSEMPVFSLWVLQLHLQAPASRLPGSGSVPGYTAVRAAPYLLNVLAGETGDHT